MRRRKDVFMNYDQLLLKNQLCFPLYASSKIITGKYKHYLDEIGLTYTQYITLMVLWEHKTLTLKELGKYIFLDSGTLTPLLKRLENKGLIHRVRSKDDERKIMISLTKKGVELKEKANDIPKKISCCLNLNENESATLYQLLYKIIDSERSGAKD